MSSYGGAFGSQKIATPKELVKMLDQYVVGQTHAKKACCHTLHFEGQLTVTAAVPCTRQPVFYNASQGLYTQISPLTKWGSAIAIALKGLCIGSIMLLSSVFSVLWTT